MSRSKGCRAGTLAAALCLSAVAGGCDNSSASKAQAQPKGPAAAPPVVFISKPLRHEIVEWDEYTGRFDAVETVEVRARVRGELTGVHFKDGALVEAGEVLYEIDPRTYKAALDVAQANKANAQANLKLAEAEGIPTFALSHKGLDRAEYDRILDEELRRAGVQYVALAGHTRSPHPRRRRRRHLLSRPRRRAAGDGASVGRRRRVR